MKWRPYAKPTEPGPPGVGRVFARFATAGVATVDLRYSSADRTKPVIAKCNGCAHDFGGGEGATRNWAISHAKQCEAPPLAGRGRMKEGAGRI
jgi:hypothetical protein